VRVAASGDALEFIFDAACPCTVAATVTVTEGHPQHHDPIEHPATHYSPGSSQRHAVPIPVLATTTVVTVTISPVAMAQEGEGSESEGEGEDSSGSSRHPPMSEQTVVRVTPGKVVVQSQGVMVMGSEAVMAHEEFFAADRCVVCFSCDAATACLPCRHLCMCNECAELLRLDSPTCPVCRSAIGAFLHIAEAATQPPRQSVEVTAAAAATTDGSGISDGAGGTVIPHHRLSLESQEISSRRSIERRLSLSNTIVSMP
jgi:hypothetical protein